MNNYTVIPVLIKRYDQKSCKESLLSGKKEHQKITVADGAEPCGGFGTEGYILVL